MKRMKRMKCILLFLFCCSILSCSDWLKVSSEDRIMEGNLYSSPEGFMTALNGIYIDLMNNSLYGQTLVYGTFDVMAQYYNCRKQNHSYQKLAEFDGNAKIGQVSGFWTRAYSLLANINTVLEHCESDREVLSDEYYHVIRGEALALRAMIHFELFRVFGPIYSEDKETECIPYAATADPVVRPLLKASEIVRLINEDLNDAENTLKDYDPVITEGPLWGEEIEGTSYAMRYRQLRLNYYAVQALIARVALYCGDKPRAFEYADKVIQGGQKDNQWFPFITREDVSAAGVEDRIFRTEILFGTYNLQRVKRIFESTFGNNLKELSVLRVDNKIQNEIYEEDENDYRWAYWYKDMIDPDNNNTRHFIKYMGLEMQSNDPDPREYRYVVPLIRISEMYYIAAECCTDPVKAREYLNTIRAARNIRNIPDDADLMTYIEKEYRKEFVGEGQLFWMYKRLNKAKIPSGNTVGEMVNMEKSFYLFSIPQGEMDHRKEMNN